MKTVYIIEDEEILRNLLSIFFASSFPELQLLGMSGDGGEGVEKCLQLAPDLVIVDIQLPKVNGIEIIHRLKRKFPEVKIIIFTGISLHQTIKVAAQGLAEGLVYKISGLEGLKKAIHAVAKGEQFFSPEVSEEVMRIRENLKKNPLAPPTSAPPRFLKPSL